MPIICLEGTSAVGKTTTCRMFAEKYDAYVVEETHFLFNRPTNMQGAQLVDWYLDCQIKRWHIALEKSKEHPYVLLDGDVFKLWYDWVYGLDDKQFEYESNYFRKKLVSGELAFPHAYVLLWSEEPELRKRKEADKTRGRGSFEKHLKLVEPQIKFFTALNEVVPNYVGIHKAVTVEENVLYTKKHVGNSPGVMREVSLALFDFMVEYLRKTQP
ncbi:chloramphenicol acetyltransferase [Paenibacillus sp. RC67]|uniref:chloramphenicol acetyltransferase n=1 Tax=Paenibacillus sp. RC67 TaxID=3039392 RepID=UPI0024ACE300|nr:chloramphenicol acetyltransferase [Paenibacillus sp. RC67]